MSTKPVIFFLVGIIGLSLCLVACGDSTNTSVPAAATVPTPTQSGATTTTAITTASATTVAQPTATAATTQPAEPTIAPTDPGGVNAPAQPGGARPGAIAIFPLEREVQSADYIYEAKVVSLGASQPVTTSPDQPDTRLTPLTLQLTTVYKGQLKTGNQLTLLVPGGPGTQSRVRWDRFPQPGDNLLWFTTGSPTSQRPLRAYRLRSDGNWAVSGTMSEVNLSAGNFTTAQLKQTIGS